MASIKYRYIAEAAGVLGIIGSLIFVGMQLQLESRIAQGELYRSGHQLRQDQILAIAESEPLAQALIDQTINEPLPFWWDAEDSDYLENPSPETIQYYRINMSLELLTYDDMYFQYNLGLLPEEEWLRYEQVLKSSMTNSKRRYLYFTNPPPSLGMLGIFSLIDEVASEI